MNVSFNEDGTANLHFPSNLTITIPLEWARGISSAISSHIFKNIKATETKEFAPRCSNKRAFPSIQAAKLNNQRAGWRMRVYLCEYCNLYHVTNADKQGNGEEIKIKKRKMKHK